MLFEAFAAVVIGGVSLRGGVGGLYGVFAGVLLLSTIDTAINVMGLDASYMQVIRGALMLLAVLLDSAKGAVLRKYGLGWVRQTPVRPAGGAPTINGATGDGGPLSERHRRLCGKSDFCCLRGGPDSQLRCAAALCRNPGNGDRWATAALHPGREAKKWRSTRVAH